MSTPGVTGPAPAEGNVAAAMAVTPAVQRPVPQTTNGAAPITTGAAKASAATIRGSQREFLSRVLPWPADGEPGYINIHVCGTGSDGKKFWTGSPTTNLDQFLQETSKALTWPTPPDIYMCMSRQAMTKPPKKNGKIRAAKSQDQALALKSIFLDVDVKPDKLDKGYATLPEAVDAVRQFVSAVPLPEPTALVMSGGGLHCYWVSSRSLTLAEWQPYANGLKAAAIQHGLRCDAGVTGDCARVLRVPSTFNHKSNPPKPVRLLGMRDRDYDFATELAILSTIAPATATAPHANRPLLPGRPASAFAGLDPKESLAAGIGHDPLPPLDPTEIFKQCPHFREALKTGGNGYLQGLWNLDVLAATFWKNGNAFAHEMSRGYAGYSHDDTEALWERKLNERRDRGLGWPSCRAIQAEGCKHCSTCPHLAKGKSPLHLAAPARLAPNKAVPQTEERDSNPVATLMRLRDGGADINALLLVINQNFAVVKYGGQIVVACISGSDITFMKVEDFHKMFANLVVYVEDGDGIKKIRVSARWFEWKDRRQYLGRGVVFEPGGPLEITDDMLNLWRGFGVEPKQGDWSLMRAHILNVGCSGKQEHFDYLIKLMAYRVQHPDKPIGVAVAFLGAQGSGKGIIARTFGSFFGNHFAHITHGDQLTGRFNASLATSSLVFLDEALWAGDRKGEGVLKGLITEPTFQLEAKFRDPIMVKNRLFILVASNNDWAVPVGIGDRRWFVLYVASTYAGTTHSDYWNALYHEVEAGGAAAMLHDLLAMDLSQFDVRAVPHTAAKAQQQVLSLHGTTSWLHHVLQEGSIGDYVAQGTLIGDRWGSSGLTVSTAYAYNCYEDFSKQRREWQPEIKDMWSKNVHKALGPQVKETRPTMNGTRVRSFEFAPLDECRRQFADHVGAPDLEWQEADDAPQAKPGAGGQTDEDVCAPKAASESQPDNQQEPEYEPEDDSPDELDRTLDPDEDYWPEYDPTDEPEPDPGRVSP